MPGWARWDRWSQWGQWAGGVVFFAISGQVTEAGGAGLDGVTVTLSGDDSAVTVTAGGGLFEFAGMLPGAYTITPTKTGYVFNPASRNKTVTGSNVSAVDFAVLWTAMLWENITANWEEISDNWEG